MKKEVVDPIREWIGPEDVKIYLKSRRYITPKAKEIYNFFIEELSDVVEDEYCSEPRYYTFNISEDWFVVVFIDERDPYCTDYEIEIPMKHIYDETWKEYLINTYRKK